MKSETMQPAVERGSHVLSDPSIWVDRYGDLLYSHALSHVRNKVVAEELVEETFLNALRSRAGFLGGSTERDWLIGLLRRNMLDYFRRVCTGWPEDMSGPSPGEPALFRNEGEWAGHWREDQVPREWGEPSESPGEKEFSDMLRRCIDNLPLRIWSVFTLREIEGSSAHDIAMELGITPGMLAVALYRARLTLRRCLETNWFGAP